MVVQAAADSLARLHDDDRDVTRPQPAGSRKASEPCADHDDVGLVCLRASHDSGPYPRPRYAAPFGWLRPRAAKCSASARRSAA